MAVTISMLYSDCTVVVKLQAGWGLSILGEFYIIVVIPNTI